MKILSLNAWGGRVLEPLKTFLENQNEDVDVFCFQEIFREKTAKNPEEFADMTKANIHLYEDIENILTNYNGYFCSVHGDYYGIAIFVKKDLDVLEYREILIFENKDFVPQVEDFTEDHNRKMQYVKIKINNEYFNIMNVHGHWVRGNKLDNHNRLKQSDVIIDFVKSLTDNKILCGDFNLRPDTESIIKIEKEGMINLIKKYDITSTRTSFYEKSEKYADYIFISSDIRIKEFQVLCDVVSDHSPLLLEFN